MKLLRIIALTLLASSFIKEGKTNQIKGFKLDRPKLSSPMGCEVCEPPLIDEQELELKVLYNGRELGSGRWEISGVM